VVSALLPILNQHFASDLKARHAGSQIGMQGDALAHPRRQDAGDRLTTAGNHDFAFFSEKLVKPG
jgi:hypothetical protein